MRPAWVDETLFPFESHFAQINGAQVHYIDDGQGPVFLGLHGNPTWSFLYRHIVTALKDRFRCIALDYPGFGLSEAPSDYAGPGRPGCPLTPGRRCPAAMAVPREDSTMIGRCTS